MPFFPMRRKYTPWPDTDEVYSVSKIIEMYSGGYSGCTDSPEDREKMIDAVRAIGQSPYARDAFHASGIAGSSKGKLVIPFMAINKLFPGALPGPAQITGDCVSKGDSNACLTTLSNEIIRKIPDEVTGKIEGIPVLSAKAIENGVICSEAKYWLRGYNGQGWSCQEAAQMSMQKGIWLRKDYSAELSLDLTEYNRNVFAYGSRTPPEKFLSLGADHQIRTVAECDGFEEVSDALYNGNGVNTCGDEGYSSSRNEDGVSQREGRWPHSMAVIGADSREETMRKYGEPLILKLNSWSIWNRGSRRILGTNYLIPEGAFWTPWSQCKNRYFVAYSSMEGWPPAKIKDYGQSLLG